MRLRFRRKPDLRGGKPADDMIFIINRIINPGLIFTGREINHSIRQTWFKALHAAAIMSRLSCVGNESFSTAALL